jgi:hypothetical protein
MTRSAELVARVHESAFAPARATMCPDDGYNSASPPPLQAHLLCLAARAAAVPKHLGDVGILRGHDCGLAMLTATSRKES